MTFDVKHLAPTLLLVALGIGGVTAWSAYERAVGRRDAEIAALEHQADSLRHRAARVDSVYVTDTVRLTRWRTQFDTLQDTVLQHLTDTVKVREFVRVADSTINACSIALRTCEQRVAQRDSIIAVQTEELRIAHRQGKIFGIPLPSRGVMFGAGIVAGWLLRK